MAFDVTTTLNLCFDLIIVILGLMAFKRKQYVLALYVALGFAMFALSYVEVMMGLSSQNISVVFLRILGYLVIIYSLLKEVILKYI
ncbi:MAG: hypothetical protein F8N15_00770, partial [Methanobacterium sp.]|nr:hypothetical protein [Methanobacterium sp.]